ncbi:O-antigen ligase family protein [Minwuia thermotolerans]|nr:O-antigen ligase family protein [Minwuia thermotolerans]
MTAIRLGPRLAQTAVILMALFLPWLAFPSDRAMAWLIAPAVLAFLAAWVPGRREFRASRPGLPLILAIAALAAITLLALLSPGWGESTYRPGMEKLAGRAGPALLAGIVLLWCAARAPLDGVRLRPWLTAGCSIAALIALADMLSGRWLLRLRLAVAEGGWDGALLDRANSYEPADFLARFNDFWMLATLALTLLAVTSGRRWAPPLVLAALMAASLLTISETSLVMALAGLIAALLVLAAGRAGVLAIMASVLAAILTTPWLFPLLDRATGALFAGGSTLTHKIRERSEIWAALAKTVPERFWLGHGIGYQRVHGDYPGPNVFYGPEGIWHPHSIFVQIWQDLGLAGAALLCVLAGGVFLAILRASPVLRPGFTALAVMVLAALGAAHSIWLGWWLCAFFMLAALAVVLARREGEA